MFNILLQVLDDGRLTDNKGRTVDFKNTIIIMTSNIGSAYLTENIHQDGSIDPEVKDRVRGELNQYFRPEFINRVDDIVVFSPLTEGQIGGIIDIAMTGVSRRLADRDIALELTAEAKGLHRPGQLLAVLRREAGEAVSAEARGDGAGRDADPGRSIRRAEGRHRHRWGEADVHS